MALQVKRHFLFGIRITGDVVRPLPLFLVALLCAATCLPVQPVRAAHMRGITDVLSWGRENPDRSYCNLEGMLCLRGDPPLRGKVKSVSIIQYVAKRGKDGRAILTQPEKVVSRVQLTFDPDGRQTDLRFDVRGDGSDIMRVRRAGEETLHEPVKGMPAPFRSVTTRDESGRPLRRELFQGDTLLRVEATYTYDDASNTVTEVNSLGQVCARTRDSRGNIVREVWSGEDRSQVFFAQSVEYDAEDKPLIYRNEQFHGETPRTDEIRWTYDGQGRLIRRQSFIIANGAIRAETPEVFTYDAAGDLANYARKDFSVRYTRDANGHVTAIERTLQRTSLNRNVTRVEHLRFTNDAQGNWLRGVLDSPDRPAIITREITYY